MMMNVCSGIAPVGAPLYETYATAKAGLAYFGEAPRRELKREGVLSIPVGRTPMMESNRAGLEPGFTRELASVVADAVAEGNETAALDVISSGLPSAQMIALDRENLAVSERLLSLKPALEEAVKNHFWRFERQTVQTWSAIVMLQSSNALPSLTFARVGGGEIHSPGDPGEFGVVVAHRSCGYGFGNARLAGFARAADKFGGEDVKIVSVSVDDRENSEPLVEKRKRGFPVAYRADARAVFAATRAFVNDASIYSRQPALAIGASGRLMPDDVLGLFPKSYLRQRTEEQRPIGGEVGKWRSHL